LRAINAIPIKNTRSRQTLHGHMPYISCFVLLAI